MRTEARADAEAVTVVAVPIEIVYRAASDLTQYPLFMAGARAVTPREGQPDTFHWLARSGLRTRRWEVLVSSRVPGARIAWRSATGGTNAGSFKMEPLGDRTRVTLRWACDQAKSSADVLTTRSLANFRRAVETGQRQSRPVDPLVVAAAVAATGLALAVVIAVRSRR